MYCSFSVGTLEEMKQTQEVEPMKQVGWIKLGAIVIALAALVAVLAPTAVGADHRLVVQVDQPFEVNGQLYPAGEVAVKQVHRVSPTSTLNEIRVGGERLGLLLAEERSGQTADASNTMTFERAPQGHLVLVSFNYRGERPRHFLSFSVVASGGRWTPPAPRPASPPTRTVAAK
jgi:hypothetical protein